jgi:hypothetical protein
MAIGVRGGICIRFSLAQAYRQQGRDRTDSIERPFTDEPLLVGRILRSFLRRPIFSATAA